MTNLTDDFRKIRVFISSTFKDMMAERNLLNAEVFPKIRKEARNIGVDVECVDLRWGISEETLCKTLEVCLTSIDECQPYFLGILGDYYGTEISINNLDKYFLERFPKLKKYFKQENGNDCKYSITELEIIYGVLEDNNVKASFYYKNDIETKGKSAELKKRIINAGYKPTSYDAVEQLGKMIYSDIVNLIHERYPIGIKEDDIILDNRIDQSMFYFDHVIKQMSLMPSYSNYIDGYFRKINDFVRSDYTYLLVEGRHGCGKTTILVNWIEENKINNNIIFYSLATGFSETEPCQFMKYILTEVKNLYGITSNDDIDLSGDTDILNSMNDMFNIIRQQQDALPLIIIIDGLEFLHNNDLFLNWLPLNPFVVKIILSVNKDNPNIDLETLQNRLSVRQTKILSIIQCRDGNIISEIVDQYLQKKLPSSIKNDVIDKAVLYNFYVIRDLLNTLNVFSNHNSIYYDYRDIVTGKHSEYGLYKGILNIYKNYCDNEEFVEDILALLCCSQYGLSENVILKIIGCSINWYRFKNIFSDYLIFGSNKIKLRDSTFDMLVNRDVYNAVSRQYYKNPLISSNRKKIIKYHLNGNEDWTHISIIRDSEDILLCIKELLWQYLQLMDYENIYRMISDGSVIFVLAISNEYSLFFDIWKQMMLVNVVSNSLKYNFNEYCSMNLRVDVSVLGQNDFPEFFNLGICYTFLYKIGTLLGSHLVDSRNLLVKINQIYSNNKDYYSKFVGNLVPSYDDIINQITQIINSPQPDYLKAISIGRKYVNEMRKLNVAYIPLEFYSALAWLMVKHAKSEVQYNREAYDFIIDIITQTNTETNNSCVNGELQSLYYSLLQTQINLKKYKEAIKDGEKLLLMIDNTSNEGISTSSSGWVHFQINIESIHYLLSIAYECEHQIPSAILYTKKALLLCADENLQKLLEKREKTLWMAFSPVNYYLSSIDEILSVYDLYLQHNKNIDYPKRFIQSWALMLKENKSLDIEIATFNYDKSIKLFECIGEVENCPYFDYIVSYYNRNTYLLIMFGTFFPEKNELTAYAKKTNQYQSLSDNQYSYLSNILRTLDKKVQIYCGERYILNESIGAIFCEVSLYYRVDCIVICETEEREVKKVLKSYIIEATEVKKMHTILGAKTIEEFLNNFKSKFHSYQEETMVHIENYLKETNIKYNLGPQNTENLRNYCPF